MQDLIRQALKPYYYVYAYCYAFVSWPAEWQRHSNALWFSGWLLGFAWFNISAVIDLLLNRQVLTDSYAFVVAIVLLVLFHVMVLGNGRGIREERRLRRKVEKHRRIAFWGVLLFWIINSIFAIAIIGYVEDLPDLPFL